MQLKNINDIGDADIYVLSDAHLGSTSFKETMFKKVIKEIHDNTRARVIFLGDSIEAITVDDKRYIAKQTHRNYPDPVKQAQAFRNLIVPIRDKIIVILEGNHERKLRKAGDLIEDIICYNSETKQHDISYGTYTCVVTINDRWQIFCWHGGGMVRNKAGSVRRQRVNRIESITNKMKDMYGSAIVMVMGHIHLLEVGEPLDKLYMTSDGKKLKETYTNRPKIGTGKGYIPIESRWFCSAGSFKGMYELGSSGYEEVYGLDPAELGYLKIIVRNGELKDIERVVI